MKRMYIIPLISVIKIDSEISLRLTSGITDVVKEPGSGAAGMGGETNNSGETGWERADAGPQLNNIQNVLWQ